MNGWMDGCVGHVVCVEEKDCLYKSLLTKSSLEIIVEIFQYTTLLAPLLMLRY